MHVQRSIHRALVFVAALAGSQTARAYHDETRPITDDTAFTLPAGSVRLGLWKFQWSPHDRVTLGSYTLPWVLLMGNLHAKWRFFDNGDWAVATQVGVFRFNTDRLTALEESGTTATLTVLPADLFVTKRFGEDWSSSLAMTYTVVRVDGEVDQESFEGAGGAALNNLQFSSTTLHRFTRVTAVSLHARLLAAQHLTGTAKIRLEPDEFTEVTGETDAESDILDFSGAFSLMASAVFSWSRFQLRVGAGYGNYNVPALNLTLPRKTPIGELDVYWVF